jgi:hypothetical protein
LMKPLGNSPPVLRPQCDRFQNQEIQRALRKFKPSVINHQNPYPSTPTGEDIASPVEVQGESLSWAESPSKIAAKSVTGVHGFHTRKH